VVLSTEYTNDIAVGETVLVTADTAWEALKGDHMITASVDAALSEPRQGRAGNARSAHVRVADEILEPPPQAAAKGFNVLTFSDDFDSIDTVDTTGSGVEGYHWYVTRPWGEDNIENGRDYTVKDSVMNLHNVDTRWNYGMCTIDTMKPVGYAFNKGYIEYRLRMKENADTGHVVGIRIPAVWSFGTKTIWADALGRYNEKGVELDWMENWGDKYEPNYVTVTLHDTFQEQGKEGQTYHYTTSGGNIRGTNVVDGEWHVMSMQWSDGKLLSYIDGRMVDKIEYGPDRYPYPRPKNCQLGTFSHLDEQNMPIIIGGADDFPLELDWVRVWTASEDTLLRYGVDE
jgi:hypothetical protein